MVCFFFFFFWGGGGYGLTHGGTAVPVGGKGEGLFAWVTRPFEGGSNMITLHFPRACYASLHVSLILMLNLLQSQIHAYSCRTDHMPYKPRIYYTEHICIIHVVFHYANVNPTVAHRPVANH
jgi:hypothetical protein